MTAVVPGGDLSKIIWGNGVTVTDLGNGVIRVDAAGGGSAEDGIQFDTDPQTGDWLWIKTTTVEADPVESFGTGIGMYAVHGGIEIDAGVGSLADGSDSSIRMAVTGMNNSGFEFGTDGDGNSGIFQHVHGDGNGGITLDAHDTGNSGVNITARDGASDTIVATGGGDVALATSFGAGRVAIQAFSTTQKISFFGAAGAAQQAEPATIAEIVALLKAYGLSA